MHRSDDRSRFSLFSSRWIAVAGVAAVAGVGGWRTFLGAPGAVVETSVSAAAEEATDATVRVAAPADAPRPTVPLNDVDHPRIDYWVERFATVPEMREKFEGFLLRGGRYEAMIRDRLRSRGMPEDLYYLAMIESGFQEKAYSHAAASGLWQFISATGQRYGLRVDYEVDERNDPLRATDAALDYLQDLHDRFGSWYLAAAAYNTGEGRVGRIMRRYKGRENGSDADYFRILDRLPSETRDYVPLMLAARRIAEDPARYGFDHVEPEPALTFDVVQVERALELDDVASATGADLGELERLNPHLRRGRTPRGESFELRLPLGVHEAFRTAAAELEEAELDVTRYKVRRGDNLTVIARRHGTSVNALRAANGLRSDRIYAGQELTIN